MKTIIRRASVALAAFLGAAAFCSIPAAAAQATTCGWPVKADPDLVNIAYPDQSAEYWAAPFYAAPGSEMTIRGRFPLARYMSFHVYEGSIPVDAVTDRQIVPSRGVNPYVIGERRVKGGRYVLHIVAGQRPAHAPPNTLYAASLNGEPNVAGVVLYRLYIPQGSSTGEEPLPQVSYTDQTGASALPCPDTSQLDKGFLNEAIAGGSFPADWPAQVPDASQQPTWGLARSGASATSAGPVSVRTGNPFFANFDNVYLSLQVWRDRGSVIAFRAKAPTFADTAKATTMPASQLRYWSICSNETVSTRYVACIPDHAMRIDSQGFFTVVISDAAHRPSTLLPTDNWLPAGSYPDTFVLYRQMLPDPSFAQAIQFAPSADLARQSMRDYYPDTQICTTAQFELNRCGL